MIETVHKIMTASVHDPLGDVMFVAGIGAFLLMPYAVLAMTERADRRKELLDTVYDAIAIGCAFGIVALGVYTAGIEGLIAVGVGVGLTTTIYGLLVAAVLCLAAVMGLVESTPA